MVGQPDVSVAAALKKAYPDRVTALELDQGDASSCATFLDQATDSLGGLDVLVNNAAITGPGSGRPFLDLDAEFIDRTLDVNLRGVIYCSLEAAKAMIRGGHGGVIVNISSINAFRPQSQASIYAASKAAINSLTQSLAKELGTRGIRVVGVAPGDIWTDTYEEVFQEQKRAGLQNEIAGQAVLGQGQPRDVAEAVCFLASENAQYITGQTLIVDGGLLA